MIEKLNDDEVHIWSVCIPSYNNQSDYYFSLLSKYERERTRSYRFQKDQKQYVITRGILRLLLSRYTGISPKEIEIGYGPWGKPNLSNGSNINFNLSHSKEYALYAIVKNYDVGIDIEYIDNTFLQEENLINIFSREDSNFLLTLTPEDRIEYFFMFWVCKEAFLKALGKGFLGDNNILSKPLFQKILKPFSIDKVTYPYIFKNITNYASALYVEGPPLRPLHHVWNKNSIIF